MKVLVIYYSQTGKTKRLAEEIAKDFEDAGNDIELKGIEPVEEKDYTTNVREARENAETKIKSTVSNVSGYDLICVGTPVWSSSPATCINGYIASITGIKGKKVVCFATSGGGSRESTFKKMRKKLKSKGATVVDTFGINSTRPFSEDVRQSVKDFVRKLTAQKNEFTYP